MFAPRQRVGGSNLSKRQCQSAHSAHPNRGTLNSNAFWVDRVESYGRLTARREMQTRSGYESIGKSKMPIRFFIFCCVLVAAPLSHTHAWALEAVLPGAAELAALDQKRAMIAAETARLSAEKTDHEPDRSNDALMAQLRAIDALYVQHKVRLQERQHLEVEKQEIDREIETLDKFEPDEPKPYSFLLLDGLKDQLSVEQQREKALTADSKNAEKLLAAAHRALDQSQAEQPPDQRRRRRQPRRTIWDPWPA